MAEQRQNHSSPMKIITIMIERDDMEILKIRVKNIYLLYVGLMETTLCVPCNEMNCYHYRMKTMKNLYRLLKKPVPIGFEPVDICRLAVGEIALNEFYLGLQNLFLSALMKKYNFEIHNKKPRHNIDFYRRKMQESLNRAERRQVAVVNEHIEDDFVEAEIETFLKFISKSI